MWNQSYLEEFQTDAAEISRLFIAEDFYIDDLIVFMMDEEYLDICTKVDASN